MAHAVTTCVHCGFCLPACPTYRVLGEEMDSPRGRIVLMKQVLEGTLAMEQAEPFVDRCLGCLACETACPSGVRYRELVVPFRARVEQRSRSLVARVRRAALLSVLESPRLFRAALAGGTLARLTRLPLPARLRSALSLLPAETPPRAAVPQRVAAAGTKRGRVALLTGCVQRVLRPSITDAAIRLLAANGIEVVIPSNQQCCGALALHVGAEGRAVKRAAHNARAFPADVDAIVTTAAGCGSAMKEATYRTPVKDVSELLDEVGLRTPLAFDRPAMIAYHDACHLAHGQGIRQAPRRLLSTIEGASVVELADGLACCGSAGLYNLEHPGTASELGRRKAASIRATGAHLVATGNIGCLSQIQGCSGDDGPPITVMHTIEILNSAYSAGRRA
jgi:glycolate oxidase iron-sulfur subunit